MIYKDTTLRVGIYTRLSADRDGTQTATARQASDCQALAEREGWEVVEVYEDTDLSGFKNGVVRPDYERMLADLEAGRIEAVLVWKLDRLSRQPGQFETVVSTCERLGARILSVHESADMTSPAGLAMMRVGMAFANMESQTMSLRMRRQRAEAADAGRPNPGGLRPFGLSRDKLELVDEEAALVREAAARVAAGESVSGICRDWQARDVRSTRGNHWTVGALQRMLLSPRLVGDRVHQGRAIASTQIPAILSREEHERVCAILTAPGRGSRGAGRRALSGLVVCGSCGERMLVKRRQDRSPLYRCDKTPGTRGCGRVVVSAAPLEALVGGALEEALADPELMRAIDGDDPEAARLAEDLDGLHRQREQLVSDHYVHRLLARPDFLAAHGTLERRIGQLERALGRRRRLDVLADLDPAETIAAAWASRGAAWARSLAGALLRSVEVSPAPLRGRHVFDPARVALHWLAE